MLHILFYFIFISVLLMLQVHFVTNNSVFQLKKISSTTKNAQQALYLVTGGKTQVDLITVTTGQCPSNMTSCYWKAEIINIPASFLLHVQMCTVQPVH